MSLSLKIDNQFIALPDSTEISIEASNPIFSDAGAKTYLFEVPVESLRYIIGNADEIYGESLYDVLEGKRAEIYIDGVQFFSGVVNLEDEISIEDGKIAVSIASGNLEFAQMIEGMNCRDVELLDEIEIGYVYDSAKVLYEINDEVYDVKYYDSHKISNNDLKFYFPENYIAVTKTNILNSYLDGAPFCNIRRCFSTQNTAIAANYIESHEQVQPPRIKLMEGDEKGSVVSLEYNSMRSAPCFYVLYFLECVFRKLDLDFDLSELTRIEDANRLAFVNTSCMTKRVGEVESVTIDEENKPYPGFGRRFDNPFFATTGGIKSFTIDRMTLQRQKVVATSGNFPNKSVVDIFDAIQSIFNVRFIHKDNKISVISIPQILRSTDCESIHVYVYSAHRVENMTLGFKLTYNADEEDTHYDFDGYSSVETKNLYSDIIKEVSAYNPTVYVDTRNGNAYVTKVSEEAVENGEEKELNPSLFEVGGYASAYYGDCSNEEHVEEVVLPFTPIINNDVNGRSNIKKAQDPEAPINTEVTLENRYALLVDVGEDPGWTSYKETVVHTCIHKKSNRLHKREAICAVSFYDYNPEEKTEADFMLGIMRGPGSDAAPETFGQDFDGEGNYRVAYTAANYAFTSDSIDNCNRDFDYNGTGEGVGEDGLEGRISLKLRAGKYDKEGSPIKDKDGNTIVIQDKNRAERGLYDQFWKEYAYFTINKKIIRITCGMEIADITNLDWTKRYKIGEWTGFIANYSFNVNKNGMSEVELDMYYI